MGWEGITGIIGIVVGVVAILTFAFARADAARREGRKDEKIEHLEKEFDAMMDDLRANQSAWHETQNMIAGMSKTLEHLVRSVDAIATKFDAHAAAERGIE